MDNKEFQEQEELSPVELTFSPAPEEPVLSAEALLPDDEAPAAEDEIPAAEDGTPAAEEAVPAAEDEMSAPEPVPAEPVSAAASEIPDQTPILPPLPDLPEILTDEELRELELPLLTPSKPEPLPQEEPADEVYGDIQDAGEIDDTPAQAVLPRKRAPRKGRPKNRSGEGLWGIPSILSTAVWLVLVVVIGVTAGRMFWVCAADVLAFGREDKPVTITVYEKDTMEDITEKLFDAGLIRYRSLFNFYVDFAHAEEKIKPGIYDLNTRYDYHALVNFMTPSSNRTIVKVMIPEGYTCQQIFALLEENKVCTAVDLAAYAASGELDEYWFLEDVERVSSNSLEGFLFPDTYEFYKNESPRSILQRMLNNFENRFDEEMIAQIDSLNDHLASLMRSNGRSEEYIQDHLFTVREVAIVASLIEKETAHSGESPRIASVIYNRLFNWGDTPAYLNIDAAIVYALGGKTSLTREDLQVDSPYNTYLHTGLTPTPISNPGLTSLKAALTPESTNYYFYVLNPAEGSHQFSATREEHEGNVARFAAEG